jgi:ATP:ADP antiporter, AAA family
MDILKKEHRAVLLVAISAAISLTGYKILRSVTDSLFLSEFSAQSLPYVMMTVPVAVALAMFAYSRVLKNKGSKLTLVLSVVTASILFFLLFPLIRVHTPFATAILYVIKEVYVVILVGQHWSLVNSVIRVQNAKRLNGPVIGIASLLPFLAGLGVPKLIETLGSVNMLWVVGVITLSSLVMIRPAFSRIAEVRGEEKAQAPRSLSEYFAIDLFRKEKTVLWLAILVAVTQMMSVFFELTLYEILQKELPVTDARSVYMFRFWNFNDLTGFFLTFFVSPWLLTRFPLKVSHYLIPIVHFSTAIALCFHPGLWPATAAFFIFKSLDYNIFIPAREILYIPLSYSARFRAKQLIDSVIYRSSKGVTSGVLAGLGRLAGSIQAATAYPPAAATVAVFWLWVAKRLIREHLKNPRNEIETFS